MDTPAALVLVERELEIAASPGTISELLVDEREAPRWGRYLLVETPYYGRDTDVLHLYEADTGRVYVVEGTVSPIK